MLRAMRYSAIGCLSLTLLSVSAAEYAGQTPKSDAVATDTIAMITQHRPTSGDGKPGIFRMQGEVAGDLVLASGSRADTMGGSAGFFLPITDGRMSIRIGADLLRYEFGENTDIGLGDLGLRWDWAPKIEGPNALLVEVDTTWDTASRDRLGVGTHTIAPGVTYVIPIGKGLTFAPAIDHRMDWGKSDGADISLTRIHGYVGWSGTGKAWALLDPSLNLDHEGDRSWLAVDALVGIALSKEMSVWLRPGFNTGEDRPYDVHCAGGLDFQF